MDPKLQRDRILWVVAAASVILWGVVTTATAAVDLGAAVHDATCPDHGWAVRG